MVAAHNVSDTALIAACGIGLVAAARAGPAAVLRPADGWIGLGPPFRIRPRGIDIAVRQGRDPPDGDGDGPAHCRFRCAALVRRHTPILTKPPFIQ